MIRVHFTAGDLLRLRFAAAPAPLVELGLALATLQGRDVIFDGWRRNAAATLPRAARPLLQLAPPAGTGPTFLDPLSDGIDDGLDEVMSSPGALVHTELRRICSSGQPITPWNPRARRTRRRGVAGAQRGGAGGAPGVGRALVVSCRAQLSR